jgi:DNA-binding transcriptional MerR regulator
MQIGEVAQRTELSLRSLRHYDEVGLLQPSGRSEGGFRLYTAEDVDKLLVIRRMKPLGFTLEEMVEVMGHIETLRNPAGVGGSPTAGRDGRTENARRQLADTLGQGVRATRQTPPPAGDGRRVHRPPHHATGLNTSLLGPVTA